MPSFALDKVINSSIIFFKYAPLELSIITLINELIWIEGEEINTLSNAKDGIMEGYIYSTKALSKNEINRIEKAISSRLNKEIYLIPKIDENLIGGFKVVINDYVFDASIKNKLEGLKSSLKERGL